MKAKSWAEHKTTIVELYRNEGKTLNDVRSIMKRDHRFNASIRSYKSYFAKWQIRKYNCKKRIDKCRITPTAKAPAPGSRPPPNVPIKKEVGEPPSSTSSRGQFASYHQPLVVIGRTAYSNYEGPQWTRPDENMLHNLCTPTQIMFPSITAFPQENDSPTAARHIQSLSDMDFMQPSDLNGPCHMYPFWRNAV
ncbi:Clr5 domain-containing protein [Fusarium oxysporum f. sp. albedinis]|nr:Clr5 domain-containing protein [Fusarium oxysporum f. sp. albedinis]